MNKKIILNLLLFLPITFCNATDLKSSEIDSNLKEDNIALGLSEFYGYQTMVYWKNKLLNLSEMRRNTYWDSPEFCRQYKLHNWKRKLEDLPQIKSGMSWHSVMQILGEPDGTKFCPENIIQYTIAPNLRPSGEDGLYIEISFDGNGKVISAGRMLAMYGPEKLEDHSYPKFIDWKREMGIPIFFKELSSESSELEDFRERVDWRRKLADLPQIKRGISWHRVLQILGKPDGTKDCPPNIIQYSINYSARPEGEDGLYIRIFFDKNGKAEKIERVKGIYGPQPY